MRTHFAHCQSTKYINFQQFLEGYLGGEKLCMQVQPYGAEIPTETVKGRGREGV